MSVALAPSPFFTWFTTQGLPAVGYQLYSYVAGTSTPQATYSDSTETVQNPNPVILNSAGYASVWLVQGETYKLVLKDASGNPVSTQDQISGGLALTQSLIGALLYPRTGAESAAGVTPTNYAYHPGNWLRYGADPLGVVDSTVAIQSAINCGSATTGTTASGIAFGPPGNYLTSATLQIPGNNIWLCGAGADATTITMTNATQSGVIIGTTEAVTVNCQVSDLTIATSTTQTAGSGIELMNAGLCAVRRVRFGYNMNWCLDLDAASPAGIGGYSYYVEDCEMNTCVYGIVLGETSYPANVFISGVTIDGGVNCIAGVDFLQASGVYLNGVSINSCQAGFQTNPATGNNVNSLFFEDCLADTGSSNSWNFITSGGKVVEVMMLNCWGGGAGNVPGGASTACGVLVNQGSGVINGLVIQGGIYHHNLGAGIYFEAGTNLAVVGGAQVYQNSFTGSGVRSGIEVAAGVSGVLISGNICGTGGYFGVVNALANNQEYGIAVASGASNNYIITNNLCLGNVVQGSTAVGGIGDGGSGANKTVTGNVGYNPLPKTSITVTASPFTYTNDSGGALMIAVQGGTVSAVVVDGLTIGAATNGAYTVPQGQAITVTYSSAPTMSFLGLQ